MNSKETYRQRIRGSGARAAAAALLSDPPSLKTDETEIMISSLSKTIQ